MIPKCLLRIGNIFGHQRFRANRKFRFTVYLMTACPSSHHPESFCLQYHPPQYVSDGSMGPRHPITIVTPVPSDSIVSDSTSLLAPQDCGFVEERLSPCAGTQITLDQQVFHIDPSDVLLCDLGNKALSVEDLANALRLWSRPAVLIAAHNEVEHLPSNIPPMILFLDLSWNRLTSLDGFATLRNLRELDVSHNALHSMLGLVANTELRVLRLAHNRIRRVEGLEQLKLLEEVDLSYNLLRTTTDVRALSLNAGLRDLRMEGNPLCVTGVPHGSLKVHMHHLLPGTTLLHVESRTWTACSSSAPPPSSAVCSPKGHRAAVESRTPSSTRRSGTTRSGRTHAVGVRDNLGSSRRWHDPRLLHNLCHVNGGHHWRTGKYGHALRVVAPGRHRLTKARGSYAKMHLASLRKSGETTTALAEEAARDVPKENIEHRRRGIEPTGSKAQSQTPPPPARGCKESPEACEGRAEPTERHRSRNLQRGCTVPAPSSSRFPPKGSSRAQRAAARRLAWNQARHEGRVGTATSGVRSSVGSLRRTTAQGSSNPSTRAKVTFVKNRSRCRQEPASYATTEPNKTNEGEGSLSQNGSPQIGWHRSYRQLQPRARVRGRGEARSGENGSSRQGSAVARAENKSIDCRTSADRLRDHRGRWRGHSRVIAGVGRGPERRRSFSTEHRVQGRRSRENSLRQRNKRTYRPIAPPVSRSLPREDAAPRRGFAQSGYDGGLQRDRNIDYDFDGFGAIGSDAPRGREYHRTGALEHHPSPMQPTRRGGDEAGGYLHPEVNKADFDGTREQPSAGRGSFYVSPLSPEGILQRASASIQAAGSHSVSLVDAARPYRWRGGFFEQEGTTNDDQSGRMQCWGDQRIAIDHVGDGTMRDYHELSSSPEDGLRLPFDSPPEREACYERRTAWEGGLPTERVIADRMHRFPDGVNIDGYGVRGPGRTIESTTSSRFRRRNSERLCRVASGGEGQSNSDAASCISDHGTGGRGAEAEDAWYAAQDNGHEPLGINSTALEEEMDVGGGRSGARPMDRLEANNLRRIRSRHRGGKTHELDVNTEKLMTPEGGRRELKNVDRAGSGRAVDGDIRELSLGTTHEKNRADKTDVGGKPCVHHQARVVRHGSAPELLKHDTLGLDTDVSLRGAPHADQAGFNVRDQEDVESLVDTAALEEGIAEMIASILLEDER